MCLIRADFTEFMTLWLCKLIKGRKRIPFERKVLLINTGKSRNVLIELEIVKMM